MTKSDRDQAHEDFTQAVDEGRWPTDNAVPLPEPFVNQNGAIQNLLLKPLQSVAALTSVRGAIRANHYHRTDWHYAYVVRGRVLYFERAIGEHRVTEPQSFGPGEMFFTPPLREHAMLFTEDSLILTFAKNVRSHEEHEADLVRVAYVTEGVAKEYLK